MHQLHLHIDLVSTLETDVIQLTYNSNLKLAFGTIKGCTSCHIDLVSTAFFYNLD